MNVAGVRDPKTRVLFSVGLAPAQVKVDSGSTRTLMSRIWCKVSLDLGTSSGSRAYEDRLARCVDNLLLAGTDVRSDAARSVGCGRV